MKKTIIGYSRLGREIPLFHSGRGDAAVLIIGGIHAREHITCDLTYELWRMEGKNTDCIPCLNPDGRAVARGEERPRIPFGGDVRMWKANAFGVDLNVNFDAGWGTGARNVIVPGPENYIGPYPESEPETKAVCDLIREKKYSVVVSYHALGEEVYWGFGPNFRHKEEAATYAAAIGYPLKKSVGSAGGLKDWYCNNFPGLGLTVEVGKSEWGHPCPENKLKELLLKHEGSIGLLERIGGKIARENDGSGAYAG